ncbi:cupin domain-containing protein [Oceanobacillus indicireducens]|uniref:Cupin type-2 domain-containing protein n=1 Tax=Oceanobacillus indicireducens TaxID=1004261 RepID=A0A917XS76_9BACI|nr:cupin domain-containing protein [Oceanobacillus indicireducens]GGN51393.1 hypothetical protein GCM10007971_05850 [Oceanobacillus indicireducens]
MYHGYYPYPYYPQGYYPYPYPYEQPVYPDMNEDRDYYPLPEEDMERQGDQGGQPYVFNIEHATERNRAFRRAIWTGTHLQLTLMRIMPGEDIGLEIHPDTDQFLRIEDGRGVVQMGPQQNQLTFERRVREDDAILVPAGTWHNIINTGRKPLLLYSIYAPPEHPKGTVHQTKEIAMQEHREEE